MAPYFYYCLCSSPVAFAALAWHDLTIQDQSVDIHAKSVPQILPVPVQIPLWNPVQLMRSMALEDLPTTTVIHPLKHPLYSSSLLDVARNGGSFHCSYKEIPGHKSMFSILLCPGKDDSPYLKVMLLICEAPYAFVNVFFVRLALRACVESLSISSLIVLGNGLRFELALI